MKSCPICHMRSFDDMELCYGCLHRFTTNTEPQHTQVQETQETEATPESSLTCRENTPNIQTHNVHEEPEPVMVVRIEIPASLLVSSGIMQTYTP